VVAVIISTETIAGMITASLTATGVSILITDSSKTTILTGDVDKNVSLRICLKEVVGQVKTTTDQEDFKLQIYT
jgi:hypothetical protein